MYVCMSVFLVGKRIAIMWKQLENAYSFLDNAFKWSVIRSHVVGPGWEWRKFVRFPPRELLCQQGSGQLPEIFWGKTLATKIWPVGKSWKDCSVRAEKSSLDPWISREKKPFSCLNRERSAPWKNFPGNTGSNSKFINDLNQLLIWWTAESSSSFASMRSDSIWEREESRCP